MHGGVRISYMHFSFAWSANLGHASWHLKETWHVHEYIELTR